MDDEGQDNIIAALGQHDRVVWIDLKCPPETFSAVTQKPFPVLKYLRLFSADEIAPVLHEEFSGGIRTTSSNLLLKEHWISEIPQTCFVLQFLVPTYLGYPNRWIHLTRGDGHLSGHVAQS